MTAAAVHSIPTLFEQAVERAPWKTWLSCEDAVFSYEQAAARVGSVASALMELGVGRGTFVLATTRNSADYLFTWLGIMHLGAVLTPVNPHSAGAELESLLAQVRPALIVTDGILRQGVGEASASVVPDARVVSVEDLAASGPGAAPPIAAEPDDLAVMIPTSGTTGRSKLVMQTQRAYALAGEGFGFWMGLTDADRLMTSLPLFHVNAQAYSVLGSIAAGASLALLPRFSASAFLEQSRRHEATEFNAIGAMLELLMRQPEREDDADNPLRLCYTGPSPTRERHTEMESRFGIEIVCGYGLSESLYGLIWKHGTRPYGSLGSPRQHPTLGEINQARVRDEEGRPVGVGGVGELELRNPAVMLGYYDMPAETAEVLSDGWLRTGDLVQVNDDGTYTFEGRCKEVIRRRGENLSPVEVETALQEHPDVAEAAVIGVPSELSEEDVKAFIVYSEVAHTSFDELRDFVAERLAAFKVPRYFESVPELPHTPTGRIAKHELPAELTGAEADLDPRTGRGARSLT